MDANNCFIRDLGSTVSTVNKNHLPSELQMRCQRKKESKSPAFFDKNRDSPAWVDEFLGAPIWASKPAVEAV